MNILHISNGYADSKVHSNLTRALDALGISQTVYCPVREERLIGMNQFEGKHIQFEYSFCIKPWYKYVYHYKVVKLYNDLKKRVNLKDVDLIHAPSLFSDGAIAYMAYKEFGIPYVVAVRSTDTHDFIDRKLIHTFPLGKKILLNAQKIYFISAYGKVYIEGCGFIKSILSKIKSKFELRPNGVDDIWLENIVHEKTKSRRVCYVGTFLRRKNIARVIEAVSMLRRESGYEDVVFRIIGGGADYDNTISQMIDSNHEFVEYLGKIYDKQELMKSMRECAMFVMPSWAETFGLVYIEALSQGLPIIYTKNDGIDRYFDDSVGVSVNCKSVDEIKNAIKYILDNPDKCGNRCVDFEDFNWKTIASNYLSDYKEILR